MIELKDQYDVIIVGAGVAGLYAALNLPRDKSVLLIAKEGLRKCDSYLAQGGICMLKSPLDYESYFEDTMRAGHYENNRESVEIMIKSSPAVIVDLIRYGADFRKDENGELAFTREGAHSASRILFHDDCTGKEITKNLQKAVRKLPNVTLVPNCTMLDILEQDNECFGIVARDNKTGRLFSVYANYTIWACGGVGGLYTNSTNYRSLTGDALAISLEHNIRLAHIDYVQIHPTTLYSKKKGRRFLISESVRGEGAHLLDKNGNRFTDEVQARDVVTAAIRKQMEKDGTDHVLLDMRPLGKEQILDHFPTIYKRCLAEGYDCTEQPIPVVPAQHYFMGGVWVDSHSKTSMQRLYAAGETSCNGVHGKNRLASNSLLESLVFAQRAAWHIADEFSPLPTDRPEADYGKYADVRELFKDYKEKIITEREREAKTNE